MLLTSLLTVLAVGQEAFAEITIRMPLLEERLAHMITLSYILLFVTAFTLAIRIIDAWLHFKGR